LRSRFPISKKPEFVAEGASTSAQAHCEEKRYRLKSG
jgi:hypothetical protein